MWSVNIYPYNFSLVFVQQNSSEHTQYSNIELSTPYFQAQKEIYKSIQVPSHHHDWQKIQFQGPQARAIFPKYTEINTSLR